MEGTSLVNGGTPINGSDLTETAYRAAKSAYQQGDFSEAMHRLDQALVRDPDDVKLHWAYARCLNGAGRADEAESRCRLVLKADPDHFEARYLLGRLCQDRGDLAAAAYWFQQTLFLRPHFSDAYPRLCDVQVKMWGKPGSGSPPVAPQPSQPGPPAASRQPGQRLPGIVEDNLSPAGDQSREESRGGHIATLRPQFRYLALKFSLSISFPFVGFAVLAAVLGSDIGAIVTLAGVTVSWVAGLAPKLVHSGSRLTRGRRPVSAVQARSIALAAVLFVLIGVGVTLEILGAFRWAVLMVMALAVWAVAWAAWLFIRTRINKVEFFQDVTVTTFTDAAFKQQEVRIWNYNMDAPRQEVDWRNRLTGTRTLIIAHTDHQGSGTRHIALRGYGGQEIGDLVERLARVFNEEHRKRASLYR